MTKYILLMRHGKVDRTAATSEDMQPLESDGKEVVEVAQAAAEHISMLPEGQQMMIGIIWKGHYRHVAQTAEILYQALEVKELTNCTLETKDFLNPPVFGKASTPQIRRSGGKEILHALEDLPSSPEGPCNNTIMIVGHGPQMGWIAETILGSPTPITRSELLCIAVEGRRSRLLWAISPTDKDTLAEVRGKIEAKKKLAELLGGLLIGLLTFLLGVLLDPEKVKVLSILSQNYLYAATFLFFLALGLYGATMYSYDKLLMPLRFWADSLEEGKATWLVQRPPSPSVWVLYQNMVRTWRVMFTPACFLVFGGLFLISQAVFQPSWIVTALSLLVPIGILWYYKHFGPVLGVED